MVKKRFIAFLMFLITLVVFNSCSFEKRQAVTENSNTKKNITLKYWTELSYDAPKIMKNMSENDVYTELEKRTGIHIEFIHPPAGEAKEQFSLMIASKDLPDIIEGYVEGYPGGVDQAIYDGVYTKLNTLIDKYAPNFKRIRESNKEIARQTITDDGNIWSFACIQTMDEPAWRGPIVRKDWLDELKLGIPASISEWYNALRAFKDKIGSPTPLVLPKGGIDWSDSFVGAFDASSSFYMVDKKVKYGPIEPAFKDYLSTMNKWYKEGLIDKDFAVQDDKVAETLFTTGKAGALIAAYGTFDIYQALMKTTSSGAAIKPAPYPSLKTGGEVHLRQTNFYNKGSYTVITTACKNPEEAVKWFDYHYGDEGFMLFNYGIEGVSYKIVDGKPQYTDLMIKNPEGFPYMTMAWKHKLHIGPYKRDYAAYPITPDIQECINTWDKAKNDWVMPPTNMLADENKRYSTLINTVNIYKDEKILKFITGAESLNKFDDYVKQMRAMGIDECTKIQQAALDRYYKRLE